MGHLVAFHFIDSLHEIPSVTVIYCMTCLNNALSEYDAPDDA